MSYSKAKELLRLADFAAARYRGVTLKEIADEFEVSHRTAQRMTTALAEAFPFAVTFEDDDDRQRRFKLKEQQLARLRLDGDEELEALAYAIARLGEQGDRRYAATLKGLRDRLMAALPEKEARRAESDAEAMLEAHGVAARPGPTVALSPAVAERVTTALRGPYRLALTYGDRRRTVEPHGVLLGARRYLVAREVGETVFKQFRLDRISDPVVTAEYFARDAAFDLTAWAARAFGSFHTEAEYGEVVWRFVPDAAERAAEWRFHPEQRTSRTADGALEVAFTASGWLEMAWHLYQWGDKVEVIAPPELADLVRLARRSDFNALP